MQIFIDDETGEVTTSNGWIYDPCDLAWYSKVGPSRWVIVKGDVNDPPNFSAKSITTSEV